MSAQYALVTGSSSGLGLEMSQFLLEEGYTVFGASRSETDIDHPDFIDLEVDVQDEESVMNMFDEIGAETTGLHLVVNNAGIYEMGSIIQTTSEEFQNHLMVNLVGCFHVLKHLYDYLIKDQTHIIHLNSIAGQKGFANVSAYCASKFGLRGLVESCREEWKSEGVRFTNLFPGAIDTPIWQSISDDFERSKMLDPEDFISVFEMVVRSPNNMQFPDITFLHKTGMID